MKKVISVIVVLFFVISANVSAQDYVYGNADTLKMEKGSEIKKSSFEIKKLVPKQCKFTWKPGKRAPIAKAVKLNYRKVCRDHPQPAQIVNANNSGLIDQGNHGYGSGVRKMNRLQKKAASLNTDVLTIIKMDNMSKVNRKKAILELQSKVLQPDRKEKLLADKRE